MLKDKEEEVKLELLGAIKKRLPIEADDPQREASTIAILVDSYIRLMRFRIDYYEEDEQ